MNLRTKSKTFSGALARLFDVYMEPQLEFLRHHCKETVSTKDNNLCQSLCRILDCYFKVYEDTELKIISPEEVANLE